MHITFILAYILAEIKQASLIRTYIELKISTYHKCIFYILAIGRLAITYIAFSDFSYENLCKSPDSRLAICEATIDVMAVYGIDPARARNVPLLYTVSTCQRLHQKLLLNFESDMHDLNFIAKHCVEL